MRFTGRIAPDELDALRARAALAIVPSRYEEIFPLAAAESMAAGLPTVAASKGGLREFVPAEGQYTTIEEAAQRIDSLYASQAAGERALAQSPRGHRAAAHRRPAQVAIRRAELS